MGQQTTHEAVTTEQVPRWQQILLSLSVLLVAGAIFVVSLYITVGFDRLLAPSASTSTQSGAADSSSQRITLDFSTFPQATPVQFPREIVFLEPTLTPTVVLPTMPPTQSPFFCPDNPNTLPNGETCQGPPAPLPTPVPPPTCQVPPVPGVVCVVRNSVIKERT